MAIDLMSRIPDRADLDSYEKLVLLIMADRADEEGLLWYANETIARKCSMTIRGVQKVLDRLITMKLVRKMHRHDRSNFYVLVVDNLPHVERQPRPGKELGPIEYLEEEPDLFAGARGERGSRRRGERGSARHERRSVRGEPGSPDSLTDSDMIPEETPDDLLCRFVVTEWESLVSDFPDLAGFGALEGDRARAIVRRTDEHAPRRAGADARLDLWTAAFETIRSSKLLLGMATDWAVTSDWLLTRKNFRKVVEKKYGNGNDRVGTAGRGDRSAIEAGQQALSIVRDHRQRSVRPASAAG